MNPTDTFENNHGETVALPRLRIIARIYTDFPTKFGIPRQSGLCDLPAVIEFEKPFRNPDALRGITDYSHLWLLWLFSEAIREGDGESFTPTVRPPRLGGKKRVGVFASRAPYRPNPIAISCVKLESVRYDKEKGTVLTVSGIDMANNTPIYDIKPYIPMTDCHPEATEGYTAETKKKRLTPEFLNGTEELLGDAAKSVRAFLEGDPRPAFEKEAEREYKVAFSGFDITFSVCDEIISVTNVKKL